MNAAYLRQRVRTMSGNTSVLAELQKLLGLSYNSISHKMSGKREFTQNEIDIIRQKYGLTPEEVVKIFFTKEGEF